MSTELTEEPPLGKYFIFLNLKHLMLIDSFSHGEAGK